MNPSSRSKERWEPDPEEEEPDGPAARFLGALPLFAVGVGCLAISILLFTSRTGAGRTALWVLFAALGVTGTAAAMYLTLASDPDPVDEIEDGRDLPPEPTARVPRPSPRPRSPRGLVEEAPTPRLADVLSDLALPSIDPPSAPRTSNGPGVASAADSVLAEIDEVRMALEGTRLAKSGTGALA